MIVAEFRITPIGEGTSLHEPIRQVDEVLDQRGIRHEVGPLGTTLQAESMDDILDAVRACHTTLRGSAGRILTEIAIDERLDKEEDIESLRDV